LKLPFWFEAVAEQAVASSAVFALLGEEAPVNGYAPRVTDYCFEHTPEQHEEKEMEDDDEEEEEGGTQPDQVLYNEDEVVEGDEDNYPDEVEIEQATATDLTVAHH
jgi:hypothetical protein